MKYHTYRSNIIEELDRLVNRQITELWSMICDIKANMSVAALCMNLIEFLGGISNGELGKEGKVKSRFHEGVKLLGNKYTIVVLIGKIRNLTHKRIKRFRLKAFRAGSEPANRARNKVLL